MFTSLQKYAASMMLVIALILAMMPVQVLAETVIVDWDARIDAADHNYIVAEEQLICDCGATATGTGIVWVNNDTPAYCLIEDQLVTGWQQVEGEIAGWIYADPETKLLAVNEQKTISDIIYTFTDDGVLARGEWVADANGCRYSYGPKFCTSEWQVIDGNNYYFGADGYMYTGIRAVRVNHDDVKEGYKVYDFGVDGKLVYDYADYCDIVTSEADGMFYVVEGTSYYGGLLHLDTDDDGKEDAYYYARTSGELVCNESYWITKNNDLLPIARYTFGEDGKMINPPTTEMMNGIVEQDNAKYWYVDGVKTYGGLMLIDGDYYYARSSGELVCNETYWITKNNDLLPIAYYDFGEDGKMIDPPSAI